MRNTALAAYGTQAGADTAVSATVTTTVNAVSLSLGKTLLTAGIVRVGDQVDYQVDYGVATGTVPALSAILSDTLPQGLQFVSAAPMPQVSGQVLTWSLGDLAPGSTGQVRLTVRVSWTGIDTLRLRNVAALAALNGSTLTATSLEVVISNASSAALDLDKTANLLEAGLGEVVPYTLVARNRGLIPLGDMILEDRLPDGMKYVPGTAVGVDSAVTRGRQLRLYRTGPLAPDSSLVVHYQAAIASAGSAVLRNTAVATAEGGLVRSMAVSAFVRLRSGAPMETRAVIGKVWADLDGDEVQDADEPGVEGVDIWTVGGEIATSDRDGRFSFRNLQPGRHAFRLDASTLPAGYGPVDAPLADLELRDATRLDHAPGRLSRHPAGGAAARRRAAGSLGGHRPAGGAGPRVGVGAVVRGHPEGRPAAPEDPVLLRGVGIRSRSRHPDSGGAAGARRRRGCPVAQRGDPRAGRGAYRCQRHPEPQPAAVVRACRGGAAIPD